MPRVAINRETSDVLAPDAAQIDALPVFRPKAKVHKPVEGRVQKIYLLTEGGGIWFKLNQGAITIYDPQKDTVRSIRYAPNEPSIYVDEQSPNAIRSHIIFTNKMLGVPASQPNLQDYLDAHPGNVKNGGNTFYELDTKKKTDTLLQDEYLVHDAISLIRDKSIDELLPIILYLGISTDQRNQEIRRELLVEAKSNPSGFIAMFDNPMIKMRASIMIAIQEGIIKSNADGMFWTDSNRLIIACPVGQDPVDVMTKFCLTERGSLVHTELLSRLDKISPKD